MVLSNVLSPLGQNGTSKKNGQGMALVGDYRAPRGKRPGGKVRAGAAARRTASNAENIRDASPSSLSSSPSSSSSSISYESKQIKGKGRALPHEEDMETPKKGRGFANMFSPVRAMRSIKAKSGIKRKRGGGPTVQDRSSSAASRLRLQQQQQPQTGRSRSRNRRATKVPTSTNSSAAAYETASDEEEEEGFNGEWAGLSRRTRQMRNASSSSRTSTIDSHSSLRRNMRAMVLTDQDSRGTPEAMERDAAHAAPTDRRPSHPRVASSRKASYNTIEESEDEQGEEEGESSSFGNEKQRFLAFDTNLADFHPLDPFFRAQTKDCSSMHRIGSSIVSRRASYSGFSFPRVRLRMAIRSTWRARPSTNSSITSSISARSALLLIGG